MAGSGDKHYESLLEKFHFLSEMNVIDLKKECDRLGLLKTGRKDELMERVKLAMEEEIEKTNLDEAGSSVRGGSIEDGDRIRSKLVYMNSLLVAKDKLLAEKEKRNVNLEEIIDLLKAQIIELENRIVSQGEAVDVKGNGRNRTSVRDLVYRIESPRTTQKEDKLEENVGEERNTKKNEERRLFEGTEKQVSENKKKANENGIVEGVKKETRDEKYRRLLAQETVYSEEEIAKEPRYESGKVKIVGDSMIRGAAKLLEAEGCTVSCYPGIRVKELQKQICLAQESEIEPEVVAVHVGTNNIKKRSQIHLVKELNDLIDASRVRWPKAKWIIGGIVHRENVYDSTVDKLNDGIQWLCGEKGVWFYDPNSRLSKQELARDGLHLNQRGSRYLCQLLIKNIEEALAGNEESLVA